MDLQSLRIFLLSWIKSILLSLLAAIVSLAIIYLIATLKLDLTTYLLIFFVFALVQSIFIVAYKKLRKRYTKSDLDYLYKKVLSFSKGKGDFRLNNEILKQHSSLFYLYDSFFAFMEHLNADMFLIKESALKFTFFSTDMNSTANQLSDKSHQQAELMEIVFQRVEEFEEQLGNMSKLVQALVKITQENHEKYLTFEQNNNQLLQMMKGLDEKSSLSKATLKDGEISMKESAGHAERFHHTMRAMGSSIQNNIEQTSKVGDILGLVQNIIDKIHVLAINAAIEASRLGNSGKGFGVIAKEMHSLANNTSNALKEVQETIELSQEGSQKIKSSIELWQGQSLELRDWSLKAENDFLSLSALVEEIHRIMEGSSQTLRSQNSSMTYLLDSAEASKEHSLQIQNNLNNQLEGYGEIKASIQNAALNAGHQAETSTMLSELALYQKVGGEELAQVIRRFTLDESGLQFRRGRKAIRHRLLYNLQISDIQDKEFGFIGDLSPGGMMVFTSNSVKEGEKDQFKIVLPKLFHQQDRELIVRGEVRWVKNNLGGMLHTSFGFRFIDMNNSFKEKILRIMESLSIENNSLFDNQNWSLEADDNELEELEELS